MKLIKSVVVLIASAMVFSGCDDAELTRTHLGDKYYITKETRGFAFTTETHVYYIYKERKLWTDEDLGMISIQSDSEPDSIVFDCNSLKTNARIAIFYKTRKIFDSLFDLSHKFNIRIGSN